MKRCPQCEFIYEDDQSLCDMDGILLVFDSQNLPKQRNSRKQSRNRRVPVVAALVLTTVLSLVYYVATHQRKIVGSIDSSGSVSAVQPTSHETPVVASEPENKVVPPEAVSEPKPVVTKATPDNEPKKPAKPKPAQKRPDSKRPQENDSKIESFMKKTGKLLKKPFKF